MAKRASEVGLIVRKTTKAVALAAILGMPGTFTRVGWQSPPNMSFGQWLDVGLHLAKAEGAVAWWLGDWWCHGEHAYGARKALFEEGGPLAEMNFQTIANYGWIAKAVTTSRRQEVLTFYHHEVVAALSPAQQRKWLKLAIEEGWTAKELKRQIALQRAIASVVPTTASIVRANCIDWLPTQPDCDLLLTDPPYLTDVANIEAFAAELLPVVLAKVKPTGSAFVCIGAYGEELKAYLNLATPAHLKGPQVSVWTFRNTLGPAPTHAFKQNWQAVLYYYGVDAPPLDCPVMTEQFSVLDINAPDGRQGDRWHAWQKPDELCERFVRLSSKPGDLVLDPFAGSGSFLLAAARLGRVARGCDIDPEMVALAKDRGCRVRRDGNAVEAVQVAEAAE